MNPNEENVANGDEKNPGNVVGGGDPELKEKAKVETKPTKNEKLLNPTADKDVDSAKEASKTAGENDAATKAQGESPRVPLLPNIPDHRHLGEGEDEDSSHFMTYFVSISIITIIAYVTYHNRKKILGLILEGRGAARARRSRVSYSRLRVEPMAEDVSSSRTDPVRDFIY